MTPLPAFTIDPETNIYDVVGDLLDGELRQRPLTGATVTFTSNLVESDFVVWEGELNRVRRVVTARVTSDGTIKLKGEPVELLANDAGLNVEGIQWQVTIQPRVGAAMTSWWFDAPNDGDTVDLSATAHTTTAPVVGVPIPPTWSSVTGKPTYIAAGSTQALARAAISAASSADVTAAVNSLLDGAPGALNTLNELAAALGDDVNFAATVSSALALRSGAVIVSTGTETRPSSDVVLWVGGATEPTNIGADDVWIPNNSRDFAGIGFEPGLYYRLSNFAHARNSYLLYQDEVAGVEFISGRTATLTSMGIKITTAGSTGSVIRFGVWEVDGLTATLVADFGTIAGTSTGLFKKSGTAPMIAGRKYFAGAVNQGHPVTPPSVQLSAYGEILGTEIGIGGGNEDFLYANDLYWRILNVTGAFSSSSTLSTGGTTCPALIGMCAT